MSLSIFESGLIKAVKFLERERARPDHIIISRETYISYLKTLGWTDEAIVKYMANIPEEESNG